MVYHLRTHKYKIFTILLITITIYTSTNSASLSSFIKSVCMCNNIWYIISSFILTPLFLIVILYKTIQSPYIKKIITPINKQEHNSIENDTIIMKNFTDNEKKVYQALNENGGTMYQRDIVMQAELPPYTISRIMRRFIASGIVESERSGMTNKISLVKK
jgi:uncharacterized membrane protein